MVEWHWSGYSGSNEFAEIEWHLNWSEWQSSDRVGVDWMVSDLTEAENLAEIEASDWSRAKNPAL